MTRVIDLRSDTVTRPSDGMREAMARAEVGDDLLREDPSVRRLEEAAAERIGKEAALFVPSGTMANLVALLTHCGRGDEVITGHESHITNHEGMGAPALGGISIRMARNDERGRIDPEEVRGMMRTEWPRTVLVCLENTQNRCGGAAIPESETRAVAEVARDGGARVHIDGARIFNASLALETDARNLVADADTVSFCFSKGLGAPVGSVLSGPAEFIERARSTRRMVGGSMRQSGVVAAAALYALEHNIDRLAEDHEHARRLAEALSELPGVHLDQPSVDTNILFFRVDGMPGVEVRERLAAEGVLASGDQRRTRLVCHLDVSSDQIDDAINRIRAALRASAPTS
jgi:threonine aldolase